MPKAKTKEKDEIAAFAEEEERYFLNPDSVSPHLYCSICQEVFVDPQRAPCGHSFCHRCISCWLKQSNTCPEDRKPLMKHNLHHDFILENIIGDQMVACPYRKAGCLFVGQLTKLSSHKKSCSFDPSNLPDFLKKDLSETMKASSAATDKGPLDNEELPMPAKPSLKMRLFQGDDSRKNLLCRMFENKEETSKPKKRRSDR